MQYKVIKSMCSTVAAIKVQRVRWIEILGALSCCAFMKVSRVSIGYSRYHIPLLIGTTRLNYSVLDTLTVIFKLSTVSGIASKFLTILIFRDGLVDTVRSIILTGHAGRG